MSTLMGAGGYGITHVLNSWDAMPPLSEQMSLPGRQTNPELVAVRFLLKPGRKYDDAVKTFQPCDQTKEVNADACKAGAELIQAGKIAGNKKKTLIFVNNRLEGNALNSSAAMIEGSSETPAPGLADRLVPPLQIPIPP